MQNSFTNRSTNMTPSLSYSFSLYSADSSTLHQQQDVPSTYNRSNQLLLPSSAASVATTTSNPSSTRKSLAKLNAEIAKLRAMKAFTEADAEEKMEAQRDTLQSMIDETKSELNKSHQEYDSVRDEIGSKEDGITRVQNYHEDAEEELARVELSNEELYTELNEITKSKNEWKIISESMEKRMSIVLESLNEMSQSQEAIVKASKNIETTAKKQSDDRMAALYKILEEEGERRRELADIKKIDGYNVNEAIEKQRTYLKSVCGSMRSIDTTASHEPLRMNVMSYK